MVVGYVSSFGGTGKKMKTKIKRIMIVSALGWYLLSMGAADENKIKDWKHVASFDTAQECETRRSEVISRAEKRKDTEAVTYNTFYTRCIASDDPRLQ